MKKYTAFTVLALVLQPAAAWATQAHGGPEGLYVHQVAHIFFAFSMGLLIYWLNKWRLTFSAGWRFIQYAAFLFIVWNLDAFASHWLEEQSSLIQIHRIASMKVNIATAPGYDWVAMVYYLTKLDHLLCVPALFFLFLGLRKLLKSPSASNGLEEDTQ